MLLTFRMENYRSVRDPQELTVGGSAVGLFGPNAGGKSTVLSALAALRALVLAPSDAQLASARHEPFLLDEATRARPTRFEAEFLVRHTHYAYGVTYRQGEVLAEWLHALDGDRRRVWFERGDGMLSGELDGLASLVRPDLTVLSLAAGIGHSRLAPLATWLSRIATAPAMLHGTWPGSQQLDRFLDRYAHRVTDELTALLAGAGLGIVGVARVPVDDARGEHEELRLLHGGRHGPVALRPERESAGTAGWFVLLSALVPALATGGVLLVDDLDAVLHPALVAETLRLLHDPVRNLGGAQLLFAAHGEPPADLPPEHAWQVRKGEDGATTLHRAAEGGVVGG